MLAPSRVCEHRAEQGWGVKYEGVCREKAEGGCEGGGAG